MPSGELSDNQGIVFVRQGRRHSFYRSRHDSRPVIFKKTEAELPGADAIASLRHEHALLHDLDLPGVVKVLGLTREDDGLTLIMEDAGPQSLADRLRRGLFPIGEFLEVATQLAEAASRLHDGRIVHRNINPSNIVWDEEHKRATLVDFAIATTLVGLTVESASPHLLEGDLLYISPEQTGRTGRTVDSRSDLYSVGATFYEMLTGAPPFTGQDSLELVHAHLARSPRPPHEVNPQVPVVLSRIVLKLLEKEPEHRYQTAEALATDLREAKNQWTQRAAIAPFPLASHDVSRDLVIPSKLYGRDGAIARLQKTFSLACEGPSQFVVVTGAPGIGKSALVGHLEQPVLARRAFFISGKFDQLQRTVPYAGLLQAFRKLVRQLLTEPEPVLAIWRDRIEAAVAPNGQVLVEVIPDVARIIGPQPPVSELGSVESKNRFNLVFTAFLRVFARPEHPLVLFLDDLQWIDAGSLQLLEQWMADARARHFLLLGAYRDAEVSPEHPLARSLAEIRAGRTTIEEIHLGPIGREDIAQLLADALKQETARVRPLSAVVAQKTAGNPFFIRQLLRRLQLEKLIHFSAGTRGWEWDLPAIERAPLSDNVLDLMVQAIERLPADTRKLIEAAACIGHRFDLRQLAEVTGLSRTDAAQKLWPALEDGLLVPLGEAYKAPRRPGPMDESLGALREMVQFVHDRVQQAAYSFLTDERRRSLHLDIGRRLLRGASTEGSSDEANAQLHQRLFDIVDHLNLGESLVEDPAEHLRLAELNLAAGRKAKASAAYQAAFNYLAVARKHLPEPAWKEHRALALSIHRELAECAYLTGQHERAEELVHVAMALAPSNTVRLELYGLRILAATDTGDYARALELGWEALNLFGHAWPRERLPEAIEAEAAAVMQNVRGRAIDAFAEEPEVTGEETRACMRMLSTLAAPAYFSSAHDILQFIIMRLVNLSLVRGPSAFSAYGYNFYGALHNLRTGDYETGHAFGRLGLSLARRFDHRGEECKVLEVFGLIVNPWKAPLRTNVPLFKEGYRAGVEFGELQYAAYNLIALVMNGFQLGVPFPDFQKDIDASFDFSTKHKVKTMLDFTVAYRQGVRNLTGRTRSRDSFDDDEFEEARYVHEAKDNVTALAFYWVIRLQAAFFLEDYAAARKYSDAAKKVLASALGMVIEAEHVFYTALTLAALHASAPGDEKPALLEELVGQKARLTNWAKHCPDNFRHKEQLVAAEVARITGDPWQAQRGYAEAIEGAAREGFTQDEALANELRARFALMNGEPRVASLYFRAARDGYSRWGATAKVRAIEERHPTLVARPQAAGSAGAGGSSERSIDTLGLIKASQAISAETDPARLFERILRIAIEVAGAQKGFLLLGEAGNLRMRARVDADAGAVVLFDETPLAEVEGLSRAIVRYVARLNEPLVIDDALADAQFMTDAEVRSLEIRSVACVPLKLQAKAIGLLYLENNAMAAAFTAERVELVQVLAAHAAIALENRNFLQELNRELNRAEQSSRFLASAGAALVESLDYAKTVAQVVGLAVPSFADWCFLDLVDEEGAVHRTEVAHVEPPDTPLAVAVQRFVAARVNQAYPPTAAMLSGRSLLLESVSEEQIRALARDEEHVHIIRRIAPRSIISVPLVARGQTLGILTFMVAEPGRRYDERDLAVAEDLAKRCALAVDNAGLYRSAQDSIRVRDEFLSIVSHELRTPITSLKLQLQITQRQIKQELGQMPSPERLGSVVKTSLLQIDRLRRLVDDLLDVVRIQGGKLVFDFESVNVATLVQEVVDRNWEQLPNAPVQISIDIDPGLTAQWDRSRIEQVVINLVSNAVKYASGSPIRIAAAVVGERVALAVQDFGPGIPKERQARIFEQFERATTSRNIGGLGLGLYIVRKIVEGHGGTVAVESDEGKGATFVLELPLFAGASALMEG